MSDVQEAIVGVPEVATPTEEKPQTPEEMEAASEQGTDGEEAEATAPEPEEEDELEWNGKKFKGPKGAKDGFLMHGDYTRKTQEVAATRRELEATGQRLAEQAKQGEEDLNARAVFIGRAQELEKYANVDWDAYIQQDPIAAQQAFTRQQALKDELQGLAQKFQSRQQQRSSEAQQERAKRLNETLQYAQKEIKGWTPEMDQRIGSFARAKGIPDEDLQAAMSPRIYEMLYLAYHGAQALNKPAVPKLPSASVVPLTTVTAKGNAPVRKAIGDMSMEEYAANWKQREAAKHG